MKKMEIHTKIAFGAGKIVWEGAHVNRVADQRCGVSASSEAPTPTVNMLLIVALFFEFIKPIPSEPSAG